MDYDAYDRKNRIDLDAVDYNSLPFDESEKIYNKIINKEIEEAKVPPTNASAKPFVSYQFCCISYNIFFFHKLYLSLRYNPIIFLNVLKIKNITYMI